MKTTNIAIIGVGSVGAATAYACMLKNICAEILLVDVNDSLCKGEVLDLSDALSFSTTSNIIQSNYTQAAQADIIIIAAGKAQKGVQTREELLQDNKAILKDIINKLGTIKEESIVIIITNPVDTLTWYAQQLINIPKNRIIGSGTMLDSQRLRHIIAQKLHIAEQSIHTYILGEHGDKQVAALSAGNIAGLPLEHFLHNNELKKMAEQAKNKAYDIIGCKGCTCYGVASCVAALCENIIFDKNRVIPVSCYVKQYDICMSMPAIIGRTGIKQILIPALNNDEQLLLQQSIQTLQQHIALLT